MTHTYKKTAIKTSLIIKLTTAVAFAGLAIVLTTIVLNLLSTLSSGTRNIMFLAGFTLMLLGTLWKVVLEMNQEE